MEGGTVLIGIDLGTTVLKVCAVQADTGTLLASANRRLKTYCPAGGGREQRMPGIDRMFSDALSAVRSSLSEAWRRVGGIGVSAQGGSSLIADRATGKARGPMVLWNDGRTTAHAEHVNAMRSPAYWRRHVLRDGAPAGLGRLRWLREQEPELFHDGNIHIGAGEYLFHRLTGVWRQDPGNAIQIGSYDAARKRLSRSLFAHSGLDLSFVAPLRRGHETSPLKVGAARCLHLPAGIPVAGPYIDQEAAFMSASRDGEKVLQCSLGTAWVGNFTLPDDTPAWSPLQLVLPSPTGPGRLTVLPLLCGNLAWDWALRHCFADTDETAFARSDGLFEKQLLPPRGLLALPWLTQTNEIHPDTQGAGAVLGIHPHTSREDILRAMAFGLVAEFSRCVGPLVEGRAVDALVLDGGAAQSLGFRRLMAALFVPLPVYHVNDGGFAAARGALFGLDRAASQARMTRVRPPSRTIQDEAKTRRDDYIETVQRLWDKPPGGAPLVFNET